MNTRTATYRDTRKDQQAMTDAAFDSQHASAPRGTDVTETELGHIRDSLRGLRFGSVVIIVQDGVIIQIERTEKRRLRSKNAH